jgi:restriction system protein
MAIPDYQKCMLPLLRVLSDDQEHRFADVIDAVANHFDLTATERLELLPSGNQRVFDNRMGWARTYLAKAGLIQYPRRGYSRITSRGKEVLSANPVTINNRTLLQFPEFLDFWSGTVAKEKSEATKPIDASAQSSTPAEQLESAYLELRRGLATELLDLVLKVSPPDFEHLVLELLVRMGYGGSYADAARVVGKTGDEGVDGIINEDRLGLDSIYVQAKRWQDAVGRPQIQQFAGALAGRHAAKGVFITTSTFTQEARNFVHSLAARIILIDGPKLADLMIDYDVGVTAATTYVVKRIDSDYFE